ncbi:MAG: hypothetical protein HUJ68_13740 [Clostridia bacterium]|nr:hypothetical protein [Clostridia bacterium]
MKNSVIYVIAMINIIVIVAFSDDYLWPDAQTYIDAWENSISQGKLDIFRTPVYPTFLGICKYIAGTDFLRLAIALQFIIFFISIFYFNKIASFIIESKKVVWFVTLVYSILSGISSWAIVILTESLAISGSVFLIYNITQYFKTNKIFNIACITFWMLFLLFLRPAFLYLIPICILMWIFAVKAKKRNATFGVASILFIILIYSAYCFQFKKEYGVFTSSSVGILNHTNIAIYKGLYTPDFIDSQEYKTYCQQQEEAIDEIWLITNYAAKHYGLVEIQKEVFDSYKNQPIEWIKIFYNNFISTFDNYYPPIYSLYSNRTLKMITRGLTINIIFIYIFAALYCVVLLKWKKKKNEYFVFSCLLWLSLLLNIVTATIGAPLEWGRLITPSAPIFMLLLGQSLNFYWKKRDNCHNHFAD